jgi:hypothetical protein
LNSKNKNYKIKEAFKTYFLSEQRKRFPSDFYFYLNEEEFELVAICDQFPKIKHSTVLSQTTGENICADSKY